MQNKVLMGRKVKQENNKMNRKIDAKGPMFLSSKYLNVDKPSVTVGEGRSKKN